MYDVILVCILIGYIIGCINPALIIAHIMRIDIRNRGTGNLGATNATMVLGRLFGIAVLLFDVGKGVISYLACASIFKGISVAGLLGGLGAVLGHRFPFYLRFKGGKGLAAYGGTILAHSPSLFFAVLLCSTLLMIVVNYSFIFPYSASLLVCIVWALGTRDASTSLVLTIMSVLIIINHLPNLRRALASSDVRVRDYIKKHLLKKG